MVKLNSKKNRKPRKSIRKSNYNKKQARVLSKRVLNKRLESRKKRLKSSVKKSSK